MQKSEKKETKSEEDNGNEKKYMDIKGKLKNYFEIITYFLSELILKNN